jgi:hypothetical protein
VIENPVWRTRLDNHLRVEASLLSRAQTSQVDEEEPIEKKIGLRYSYPFWGNFWGRKATLDLKSASPPHDSTGMEDPK